MGGAVPGAPKAGCPRDGGGTGCEWGCAWHPWRVDTHMMGNRVWAGLCPAPRDTDRPQMNPCSLYNFPRTTFLVVES